MNVFNCHFVALPYVRTDQKAIARVGLTWVKNGIVCVILKSEF